MESRKTSPAPRTLNGIFVAFALAAVANTACNSSSKGNANPKVRQSQAAPGTTAVAAGTAGSLSMTMAPAALTGGVFSVEVALRDASGNLLDTSDVVTLTLATSPLAGATLGGTLAKAAVHGVASFNDLTLSFSGSGYVLGAASSQATVATSAVQSAPFNVAYSEDDQLSAGVAANTSPGSAQVISPSVPVFGTLGGGEVHYYKFAAKAGQVVDVASYANRLDLANWDTSLRIRLLGTDGATEIARAGAIGPDANSVDSGLVAYIPATGTYYLACDQDQRGFSSGKFGVLLGFGAVATAGAFQSEIEPAGTTGQNDTAATAEALGPGVMYGHYDDTSAGAAAPDFYKIAIGSPTRVHLELSAARSGAAGGGKTWDGTLMLYDAGGNVLWRSDNALFLDPAIDYVFTTAATYYVRVSRADYATNAGHAPYLLYYSAAPYAPVNPAPSATAAGAVAVAYGSDVSASFSAGGTQYFSFSGNAGDVVRLTLADNGELQGTTAAADTSTVPNTVIASGPTNGNIGSPGGGTSGIPGMAIVPGQPAGAPVLLQPDPASPRPSTAANGLDAALLGSDAATALEVGIGAGNATDNRLNTRQTILQATGKYFVRVTSPVAGTYGFRLEKLSAAVLEAEPNDTSATATQVGSNGWVSGVISSGTDKDHFKIHGEQGQLLTVGLLGAAGGGIGTMSADWGSSLVPVVEVRGPAGNLLAQTAADRKGLTNYAESTAHPESTLETSFRAPVAGSYDVTVYDANAQGGAKYFYALHAWTNQSAPIADIAGTASATPPPPPPPPALSSIRIQAEDATFSGTGVSLQTNPAGYEGTGSVGPFSADGDRLDVKFANVTAGKYDINIRYYDSTADQANTVIINGVSRSEGFPASGAGWAVRTIPGISLAAGTNVVSIVKYYGWTWFDYVEIVPAAARPSSSTATHIQAEDGTMSGTGVQIDTDIAGYEGTGFVGPFSNAGDQVAVSFANVAAGSYDVNIRYSSGNDQQDTLIVNGVSQSVAFANTANGWAIKTVSGVSLGAGTNVLAMAKDWGWIFVDYIEIVPKPAPLPSIRVQAESATFSGAGVSVQTDPAGYDGSGSVGPFSNDGDKLDVSFGSVVAGKYDINIRYHGGYQVNTVLINGASRSEGFPDSAAGWAVMTIPGVSLPAGTNVVSFVKDWGWMDVDYIEIVPAAPRPSSSTATHIQAEDGTLSGTGVSINTDTPGYEGIGFVGPFSNDGDQLAVSFANVAAGSYTVNIRYSSGAQQNTLIVNGVAQSVMFPDTAGGWAIKTISGVSLAAGTNAVAIAKDWGWMDVDYIEIAP